MPAAGSPTTPHGSRRPRGPGSAAWIAVSACAAWLAALACGHDWSAAGDAPEGGDVDGGRDDGAPEVDGRDDGADRPEDAAGEDAAPIECTIDTDCVDDNPCTAGSCDPATMLCRFDPRADETACGSERVCCSGACVGRLDVDNCGRCDNACPTAPHATATCGSTGCGRVCDADYLECNGDTADGCEAQPAVDESNCGECGVACRPGETCAGSDCVASWTPITNAGPPHARRYAQAFWTGGQMIVWGGHDGGTCFEIGGRYRVSTDSWLATASPAGALQGICRAAMDWTGSEMLVWSGVTAGGNTTPEPGGARYDPAADGWVAMSRLAEPQARMSAAEVWTGNEMVVWGGARAGRDLIADGGRYAPATDGWLPISNVGAPSPRWLPSAVWTGTEMIVWGGFTERWGGPANDGARYNPVTNTWTPMSGTGAPAARGGAVVVWTGREMLVWGGAMNAELTWGIDGPLGDGAAYEPATDTWRPLPGAGAPSARLGHTGVWTGTTMIVWGGTTATAVPAFDTGAIYDPATDAWTAVTTLGAPDGRRHHVAVWTGTEMIVWGGATAVGGVTVNLNDGARYRPR